jgi:hypothetical protein
MQTHFSTENIKELLRRLESIRNRDPKRYIDGGPVSIYYGLYSLYEKKHYCILNGALNEVERLYELLESNKLT